MFRKVRQELFATWINGRGCAPAYLLGTGTGHRPRGCGTIKETALALSNLALEAAAAVQVLPCQSAFLTLKPKAWILVTSNLNLNLALHLQH